MNQLEAREPLDICVIRHIFRLWPLSRGRGLLLRAFLPFLRNRDFIFETAKDVLVPADLGDWITLHGFVEGYDSEFAPSWSLVRPGAIVIDIGANIGIWTIGAAKRTGPSGKVHAFEPLESNFVRLLSNIKINGVLNVVTQKMALSNQAGTLKFFPSPNKNSGVGLLLPKSWNVPTCEVEAITLDDYCEQHRIESVDVLKVDVEGAEYIVLEGASRLLSSAAPPVIVFEMNRDMAANFDSSPEKIGALLSDFKYSVFAYRDESWHPVNLARFSGHEDLLAIPSSTQLH
jgi:FkbM family methyltransferase